MNLKSILLLTLTVGLLASACNKTTPAINNEINQTYTNTKYSYSFQYPKGYNLDSSSEAGYPDNASSISDQINVFKDKSAGYIFDINSGVGLFANFSEKGVENYLGTMINNIAVTPVVVFDTNGYKLTYNGKDKSITSDSYFIKNKDGVIFMLVVARDNSVSQEIFNSFKFTR